MTVGLLTGLMTSEVLEIPPSTPTYQATGMPDLRLETATGKTLISPASSEDHLALPSPGLPPTSRPLIPLEFFPAGIDNLSQVHWRELSSDDTCCEVASSPAANLETSMPADLVPGCFPKTRPSLTVDLSTDHHMTASSSISLPPVWITPDPMGGSPVEPNQVSEGVSTFVDDNCANVTRIPDELVCSSKPCPTIGVYPGSCLGTTSAPNEPILSDGAPAENHLTSWKFALHPSSSCEWKTSPFQPEVPSAEPGIGSPLINITTKQTCGLLRGTVQTVTFSNRNVAMSWIAERGQRAFNILSHVSMMSSFLGFLLLLFQLLQKGHRFQSRKTPRPHHCANSQRFHLADFPVQLMNRLWGKMRATILPIRTTLLLLVLPVIFLPTAGVSVLAWIVLLLWDATGSRYPTITSSGIITGLKNQLVNFVPSPLRSCCFRSRLPWSHHIGALQVLVGLWFLVHLMEPHRLITANLAVTSCFLIIAYYIGIWILFQNKMRTQITLKKTDAPSSFTSAIVVNENPNQTDTVTKQALSAQHHHCCDIHESNFLPESSYPNRNNSNNVRGKKSQGRRYRGHSVGHRHGNEEEVDMETDETDWEEDMETDMDAREDKVMEVHYDDTGSMEIDDVDVANMEVDYDDCDAAEIAMEIDDEDDMVMDVDLRKEEIMDWEELLRIRGGWDSTGFEIEPDHIFIRQPMYKTWSCVDVKTEPMDWEENITKAGWKWLNFSFRLSENTSQAPAASPLTASNTPHSLPPDTTPPTTPPTPPPPPPPSPLPPLVNGTPSHYQSLTAVDVNGSLTSAGDCRQSDRNLQTPGLNPGGPNALGDHTGSTQKGPRKRRARLARRATHTILRVVIQHRRKRCRRGSHKRRLELRHLASWCGLTTREAARARRGEKVSGGITLARLRIRQDHETSKLIKAFTKLRRTDCDIKSSSDAQLTSSALDETRNIRTAQSVPECSVMEKPQRELSMKLNSIQPASTGNVLEENTPEANELDPLQRCLALLNLVITSSQPQDVIGDAIEQQRSEPLINEVKLASINLHKSQKTSPATEKVLENVKKEASEFVGPHRCLTLTDVSINLSEPQTTSYDIIQHVESDEARQLFAGNLTIDDVNQEEKHQCSTTTDILMKRSLPRFTDDGNANQHVDSDILISGLHQPAEKATDHDEDNVDKIVSLHRCAASIDVSIKPRTPEATSNEVINQHDKEKMSEQKLVSPTQLPDNEKQNSFEGQASSSLMQSARDTNSGFGQARFPTRQIDPIVSLISLFIRLNFIDSEMASDVELPSRGLEKTAGDEMSRVEPEAEEMLSSHPNMNQSQPPCPHNDFRIDVDTLLGPQRCLKSTDISITQTGSLAANDDTVNHCNINDVSQPDPQVACTEDPTVSVAATDDDEPKVETYGAGITSLDEPQCGQQHEDNQGATQSHINGANMHKIQNNTMPTEALLPNDQDVQQITTGELASQHAVVNGLSVSDRTVPLQPAESNVTELSCQALSAAGGGELDNNTSEDDALISLVQGWSLTESDMPAMRGRNLDDDRALITTQKTFVGRQPNQHLTLSEPLINASLIHPDLMICDATERTDLPSANELPDQMGSMEVSDNFEPMVTNQGVAMPQQEPNADQPINNATSSRVSALKLTLKTTRRTSNTIEQIRTRCRRMAVERARRQRFEARGIEGNDDESADDEGNLCLVNQMDAMTIRQPGSSDSTPTPPTPQSDIQVQEQAEIIPGGASPSLPGVDEVQETAESEKEENTLGNTIPTTTTGSATTKQSSEQEIPLEETVSSSAEDGAHTCIPARPLSTIVGPLTNQDRPAEETTNQFADEEAIQLTELNSNGKGSNDESDITSSVRASPENISSEQVSSKQLETLQVEGMRAVQEERIERELSQGQLMAQLNSNGKGVKVPRQETTFRYVRPSRRASFTVGPQRDDEGTDPRSEGSSGTSQSLRSQSQIGLRIEKTRERRRLQAAERAREARFKNFNRDIDIDSESDDEVEGDGTPLEDGNNRCTFDTQMNEASSTEDVSVQEEVSSTDLSSDSTESTESSEEDIGLAIKEARIVTQLQRLEVDKDNNSKPNNDNGQPQTGLPGFKASAKELLLKYSRPAKATLTFRVPRPSRVENDRSHSRDRGKESQDIDHSSSSALSSRLTRSRQRRRQEALERARLARFRARGIELEDDDDDEMLRRDSENISLTQRRIEEQAQERQIIQVDGELETQATSENDEMTMSDMNDERTVREMKPALPKKGILKRRTYPDIPSVPEHTNNQDHANTEPHEPCNGASSNNNATTNAGTLLRQLNNLVVGTSVQSKAKQVKLNLELMPQLNSNNKGRVVPPKAEITFRYVRPKKTVRFHMTAQTEAGVRYGENAGRDRPSLSLSRYGTEEARKRRRELFFLRAKEARFRNRCMDVSDIDHDQ
ncbi:uncharacterized protein LOC119743765 [Patiria miniata]|uniref:Uncharacterized protein n=1 Tax=Patiria miniata TaxID=46514 RepID=A0A914BI72_PATMI|nr:uncharacterized protein LOC119743765 [Patiria miniata]